MKRVELPLTKSNIKQLKAGQEVLLSGTIYTARDAAHKRLVLAISKGKKIPIPLTDQTIYYTGPTPSPPHRIIGSCGPTTSARMDPFTPQLLKVGVKAMIGKGDRSEEVVEAIKRYGAIYFLAIGGAGAFLSEKIKEAEMVAYKELGAEAIYRLRVEDFPVIVGIDVRGKSVYRKK